MTSASGVGTVGVTAGSGGLDGDGGVAGVGSSSVAWPLSLVDVLGPPELSKCISGADSAAWAGCEVDPLDVVGEAG
jgi:hypothetical protein